MKIIHFLLGGLIMAALVFALDYMSPVTAYSCTVHEAKTTLSPYLPEEGCKRFTVLGKKFRICPV